MGRHSRKRGTPRAQAAETAGSGPAEPAQRAADRRAASGEGPPDPSDPATPPVIPGQEAGVRGGHPQQREPGGAWGATGTGHGPGVEPQPGPGPGPRQEYLDAFDDDVFAGGFTTGATTGAITGATAGVAESATAGAPTPGIPPQQAPAPGDTEPPEGGVPPQRSGSADGDGDGSGSDQEPHRLARRPTGGRGRTFAGVAAAAVTTVLAVVVAGQVTGGEGRKQNQAAGEEAGGTDSVPTPPTDTRPSPSPSPTTLGYAEKMSKVYPLDPELDGPGTFHAVGGHAEGAGGGEVIQYRVDVENDLPLDDELFAKAVHRTLNDDRSWAHNGARSFERVASGEADFVITLASPATTGVWCAKSGLDTTVQNVSCDSALTPRIMINAWRWAQGSKTFGDERIRQYREMLINHEVGHRLGRGHLLCEADGELAPVMMQQTKTLTTGEATCRPNAWPYPEG